MVSTVEKDIIIASLRNELKKAYKKIQVLEDENAILNYEKDLLNRKVEIHKKKG